MSSRSKHSQRSKRSNRNGIPMGIFYYHAQKDLAARQQRGYDKALGTLFAEKKENEE